MFLINEVTLNVIVFFHWPWLFQSQKQQNVLKDECLVDPIQISVKKLNDFIIKNN